MYSLVVLVCMVSNGLFIVVQIFNYAPDIFKSGGVENVDVVTATTGVLLMIITLISVPLMDAMGRRALMILGQSFMAAAFFLLYISQSCYTLASKYRLI